MTTNKKTKKIEQDLENGALRDNYVGEFMLAYGKGDYKMAIEILEKSALLGNKKSQFSSNWVRYTSLVLMSMVLNIIKKKQSNGTKKRPYKRQMSVNHLSHLGDDHMVIDFNELFNYPSQVMFSYWHKGINWLLSVNGEKESHEYLEEAPLPLEIIATRAEYKSWYDAIPQEIIDRIGPYKNSEFAILYLTSRYAAAYELFIDQPTLFWLLINKAKQDNWSEGAFVNHLQQKRTVLLKICQLPSQRSALKLIQQLKFERYSVAEYVIIEKLLNIPDYAKLNHIKIIDKPLIKLINRYPEMVGTRLINNYHPDDWQVGIYDLLTDIYRMVAGLGTANVTHQIGQCRTYRNIQTLHDRLVDEFNQLKTGTLPDVTYQDPPFLGTEHIIPITNSKELIIEGKEQKHCITSYHPSIFNKQYYVYRVTYPERATLGLTLKNGFKPEFDQLKLKRNFSVSNETKLYVLSWLANSINPKHSIF